MSTSTTVCRVLDEVPFLVDGHSNLRPTETTVDNIAHAETLAAGLQVQRSMRMCTVALVGRETCNTLLSSVVHANAFEHGRGYVLGEENDVLVLLIEYLEAIV